MVSKNNMNTFNLFIIVIIAVVLICNIVSIHIDTKEKFQTSNNKIDNSNCDCDCYNMIRKDNKLMTPVSCNIPNDNPPVFYTGLNVPHKKMKITGKYCFPIEKFTYDGVWDNSIINNNEVIPEQQKRKWFITHNKPIENVYCGDKLLILPEKKLKQGEEVCQKSNCNQYYPSIQEVDEGLKKCCNKTKLGCDVIEMNCGSYTINGV